MSKFNFIPVYWLGRGVCFLLVILQSDISFAAKSHNIIKVNVSSDSSLSQSIFNSILKGLESHTRLNNIRGIDRVKNRCLEWHSLTENCPVVITASHSVNPKVSTVQIFGKPDNESNISINVITTTDSGGMRAVWKGKLVVSSRGAQTIPTEMMDNIADFYKELYMQ